MSSQAAEAREWDECVSLMAGEDDWEIESSREENKRLQRNERFLLKMLK